MTARATHQTRPIAAHALGTVWTHLKAIARQMGVDNAGRQLIWAPVPLGIGIVLYFSFTQEPALWLSGGVTLVASLGFWIARGHRTALATLCLMIALAAAGLMLGGVRSAVVEAPQLDAETGPLMVEGRVIWLEEGPRRARILLDDVDLGWSDPAAHPARVRISSSVRAQLPAIGERVAVRAVLLPPSTEVIPGGFDFRRAAFFQRLGATGYSVGAWQTLNPAAVDTVSLRLAETRKTIAERVRTVLPGPEGAIAVALLTGERYGVPADLQDAFRVSGLAHLLAISGLHMSLLAAGVFVLVRRVCALSPRLVESIDTKKIAAIAALLGTFAYLLLSGMGVSSQRAFVMVAIGLLAILVDRNPISLRLVAVAAMAVLIVQPEALISVSFQMSFAAVICLVAAYDAMRRAGWLTSDRGRNWLGLLGFYVLGVLITDFIAGSATAPYAAYHFNRLPSYSLIANVLAVPVMGIFVMPMAILTLALLPFGLEALPLSLMGLGIGWIDGIAQMVAGWPGSSIRVPPTAPWALGGLTTGGLLVCLLKGRMRWAGVPLVLVACVQPWAAPKPFLIVDTKAQGMAVRLADGLVMSPDVPSFSAETWARAYGVSQTPWSDIAQCDVQGCVLEAQGQRIAYSRSEAALLEDCQMADIVIASVPVRQACGAETVIDRFDVWAHGAHALYGNGSEILTHRSADRAERTRPWSIGP